MVLGPQDERLRWVDACAQRRYITMGRPGYTDKVLDGAKARGTPSKYFVVGPELPDISSTLAREAIARGDAATLQTLLHDDVAKYRKWTDACAQRRYITMGRPGYTDQVLAGVKASHTPSKYFVVGPELPDISSTLAREAIARGYVFSNCYSNFWLIFGKF